MTKGVKKTIIQPYRPIVFSRENISAAFVLHPKRTKLKYSVEGKMKLKAVAGVFRTRYFLGKSVKEQNPNVILELEKAGKNGRTFGVKDSSQISDEVIELLRANKYVWNTIDTCSDRGRAVDIQLVNPITGRVMTGSSSGTAINVLYGLNDIGIGTDGGGSVMAPAIALNLYSLLCTGAGFVGEKKRESTDGLVFQSGTGFIAQYFKNLCDIGELLGEGEEQNIGVMVMRGAERYLTDEFKSVYKNFQLSKDRFFSDRREGLEYLEEIFQTVDILIYIEHDIDTEGMGDSVYGSMGKHAGEQQKDSGKNLIKILNMAECSAVSIPIEDVGSSIVIAGRKGKKYLKAIIEIGKILDREYRPELYRKYFLNSPLQEMDSRSFK